MSAKALPWWAADYEEDGLLFTVPDCSTNECPVSAITGHSLFLVDMFHRIMADKCFGVEIQNFDDWPSRIHDGLLILLQEQNRYEGTRREAQARQDSLRAK